MALPYTLMDIFRSQEFFRNLSHAAAETRRLRCETSFGAPGDEAGYTITRVQIEDPDQARYLTDAGGVVYGKPGFGLHVPPGQACLVRVHFHRPNNMAGPSGDDLAVQLYDANANRDRLLDCGDTYFNVTGVIGHAPAPPALTLFVYQLRAPPPEGSGFGRFVSTFPEYADSLIRAQLGSGGRLDFSDRHLPDKMADVLRSTCRYMADVIRVRNRSGYERKLRALEAYTLTFPQPKWQWDT